MSKENELEEVATALAYQRTVGAYSRITELEQELQELKETLAHTIENDEVAYETLKLHDQEEIGMLNSKISKLEQQIEKLIDFVLSKTECCDVCPITDTCINSEGTCPYAGILAKGEEEVTREWLMQVISRR